MDHLTYFKEHIKEELEGSKDYAEKAIEVKAKHPKWAKVFIEMSTEEMNHANKLKRMLDVCRTESTESSEEDDRAYKEIMDDFVKTINSVKGIRDFYYERNA